MSRFEEKARGLHRKGNNCSTSVHYAFADDLKLDSDFPAPRSIDGKCGALLTAEKILKEKGHEDKIKKFEEEFTNKFGYTKCIELMSHERRCNDYVGEATKMVEDILEG